VKLADRLLLGIAPVVAHGVISTLALTHRAAIVGEEHAAQYWREGRNVIMIFWHDQLLMMAKAYHGPGARILVSASKDGELIARTMHRFGMGTVRGSSSRGGRAALREMVMQASEPVDLVITPDGPRGPRHEIKEGVAALARLTGRPVIPVAFAASAGHRFASWDRFLLPYPWARTVFRCGEAILWQAGEDAELFRRRLQAAMAENLRQAELYLESHGLRAV
jgi:hypothetical protein